MPSTTIGRTSFDFTHELKAVGTVALPGRSGVRVSGVYRLQTGMPWARRVAFPCALLQYCGGIAVEPRGTRQGPAPNLLDLRVEKTFSLARLNARAKIGAYVDVFNVMNQGIGYRFFNISGPNFGTPTLWSSPRMVRGGLRYMF